MNHSSPIHKLEQRKNQHKHDLDEEKLKKGRRTDQVSVRKRKRNEHLLKRRYISNDVVGEDLSQTYLLQIPELMQQIMSNNSDLETEATRKFRILLSLEHDPPIEQIVQIPGLIKKLISFLDYYQNPVIQLEAAWSLTNVASGSENATELIVREGVIEGLVNLLKNSTFDDLKEQAIWGLGNIAGDRTDFRDRILAAGALTPLFNQMGESAKLTMLRNATWALSNFCRGKPLPAMPIILEILPWLCALVYRNEDEEIMIDALWGFSYLTEGSEEVVTEILNTGVGRRISNLLIHSRVAIKTPALRAVGNIVAGNELHTQLLINVGVLPCLSALLIYHKHGICKEACWAISNITAGNSDQIYAVINANIIPPLILLLSNAEYDIRTEAAWAISNICTGGTADQIQYLVGQGCIKPICDLLELTSNLKIILVALESLEKILVVGKLVALENKQSHNNYAEFIEYANGKNKIESLMEHPNVDISKRATGIIDRYYSSDEELQDCNPFD